MQELVARKIWSASVWLETTPGADCDPKCSRWLSFPCCHNDVDKLLSGNVKLTKSYWLQILSASPVWDSANSKAYSHRCTAAGAGGQSRPAYYPQRGRAVLGARGHSPFLEGNLLFLLLPMEGWGRKTISSDTVEPEQLLCHLKVQFSSVFPLQFLCGRDPGNSRSLAEQISFWFWVHQGWIIFWRVLRAQLCIKEHDFRPDHITHISRTEQYLPLQRIKQSIRMCREE